VVTIKDEHIPIDPALENQPSDAFEETEKKALHEVLDRKDAILQRMGIPLTVMKLRKMCSGPLIQSTESCHDAVIADFLLGLGLLASLASLSFVITTILFFIVLVAIVTQLSLVGPVLLGLFVLAFSLNLLMPDLDSLAAATYHASTYVETQPNHGLHGVQNIVFDLSDDSVLANSNETHLTVTLAHGHDLAPSSYAFWNNGHNIEAFSTSGSAIDDDSLVLVIPLPALP
jgi:hypothetical protein